MATVKGKKSLCCTESYSKYFKSTQGLAEKILFQRYNSIEIIVNKYIDQEYTDFLAQPIEQGGNITWFIKSYEDEPRRLSELDGEDQTNFQEILKSTISHYQSVINELYGEGKDDEARLLEYAIKFVNDEFVYCFTGKTILGVWGMELRDEVREPIGEAVKNLYVKKMPTVDTEEREEPGEIEKPEVYIARFNAGEMGNLNGFSELSVQKNKVLYSKHIPEVLPKEGYKFVGWDKEPNNYTVNDNVEFTAQYEKIPPVIPWYRRFWNWLRSLFLGRGCLNWLMWLLLLLLLLFLLSFLFRGCNDTKVAPIPDPIDEKPWIDDDPNVDGGGIYNPGDPYGASPTPPKYEDLLPPFQGVLPPIDSSQIVRNPGEPVVVGNRLNILMQNSDKSIMDLAEDFKIKYPDDNYSVVYYDDVVKRMQIEFPEAERLKLKNEIPPAFTPEYSLFVFDESLFESRYTPNDPGYSDADKSWYLKAVNTPQAWDITLGSPSITIAVVDNGFSLKHPDINSHVVMPYNTWTHSKDIFAQRDDHGTHVAGTALAAMDNGLGLCGIAPNSAFMPIQVADKNGFMTTTSVLDGVLYALYQGADVVNISLGLEFSNSLPESIQKEYQDSHFKEEERLWNHVMKISNNHSATIVTAAGNENMLAGVDPMNRPKNFIVVSAIDKNNMGYERAGFSNYGYYSAVSAPGVDIYSSIGDSDYEFNSGTSMAAPIVTGTIALMKSLNKDLTSEQITCILQGTGMPVNGKVGNLIQIDKALQKVKSGEFSDCTSQPQIPSTGDVQILLSWDNYNDLDLACVDPFGNTVWFKNKQVPSGGMLEIDMNIIPFDSQSPIENIYWPQNKAPAGTYQVYLWHYKQHEQYINETSYKVLLSYDGKNEEYSGIISKEDNRVHVCTFTLEGSNNTENFNNSQPSPDNNNVIEDLKEERDQLQKQLDRIDEQLQTLQNQIK